MTENNEAGVIDTAKDSLDFSKYMRIPGRFAALSKLIMRDLNNDRNTPTFSLYTKDEINQYLTNPYRYQQQLRKAITYIYGASSHFRRIIQYFTGLSDLSYVVSPYRIDPKKANKKSIDRNYRQTLNTMSAFNVRSQFPKILTVCLKEDTFYGTILETPDNIIIQQLPSDYCDISTIEGGVLNVSFNFQYFDSRQEMLPYFPAEFNTKYEQYKKNRTTRWIELDAPTSFAVKANMDILNYSLPPFAGILREVYDLEDYRQMKATKTELENYAILVMTLGQNDDGSWKMDYNKAKDFWNNLDAVLPEEIGSILTPMDVKKISFEKSNTGDVDTVADAEQNLYTAAGVSSLLFNNDKASANALLLSIKADQAMVFGIVKNIEDAVNRFIQAKSYGKNFKVTFLDVSPFNRKEMGDQYLKACQYGMPMVSFYAASQGLGQAELDSMNFLENEVLLLKETLIPLKSTATSSWAESKGATDEGGAPTKGVGEVSDSREENSEAE